MYTLWFSNSAPRYRNAYIYSPKDKNYYSSTIHSSLKLEIIQTSKDSIMDKQSKYIIYTMEYYLATRINRLL